PVYLAGFAVHWLALLPTTNLYSIVACLGPGPRGIPAMIRWLERLQKEFPFRLRGCGGATLMLQFLSSIADREGLAKRLFRLGADERGVVEKGVLTQTGTLREMAMALEQPYPIVRLWWD